MKKRSLVIHFSFKGYCTKFAVQNITLNLLPLYRYIALFTLFSLAGFNTFAQLFPAKNYPQNYFAWPVAATKGIVANFGELRPNHYHMGLDCRTDQAQNKMIVAAAAGYIAKVKIEPWGFGRAIYINHPNGLTTLYAHLNDFYPPLENYVKEQQYKLKSWAVFLDIPANLFPVQQGDSIAFSGNTGGSQGPHLHFEIRDTKTDKVLNPTLFNFQIPDTIAPDVYRLALYNRNISTYEQSPKFYNLKKLNGVYVTTPAQIIVNNSKVSFGIATTDRNNGSANRNGIYETALYDNNKPLVGFQLDSISYDETRYFNAHIDYKYRSSGGGYIEHLSKLLGYNNSVYNTTNGDGVIILDDTSTHNIKIEVKDADGNVSTVLFDIKRDSNYTGSVKTLADATLQENEFHPGYINIYENSNISFYLPQNALYDSIRFKYNETMPKFGYPVFQIHNTSVPVQSYFPVTIRAATPLPDKMVMHRFSNGRHDYKKAEPVKSFKDSNWYKASFREFGSFQLMIDTIPPNITPVGFKNGMDCSKQSRIRFVVTDNAEDLKSFTATLDGNWLRFSNDKGRTFIYTFDEMCPPGEHELKIVAEDLVGNVREKVYRFTR